MYFNFYALRWSLKDTELTFPHIYYRNWDTAINSHISSPLKLLLIYFWPTFHCCFCVVARFKSVALQILLLLFPALKPMMGNDGWKTEQWLIWTGDTELISPCNRCLHLWLLDKTHIAIFFISKYQWTSSGCMSSKFVFCYFSVYFILHFNVVAIMSSSL